MADDPLSAALEEIGYLRAVASAIQADESAVAFDLGTVVRRFDRALAALEALAKAHEPVQVYDSADGCPHPRPDEDERDGDALAEWFDDHPGGAGIVPDADVEAICLLSPRVTACRACSELVYGRWGDENQWVSEAECIARPLITARLLGEAS